MSLRGMDGVGSPELEVKDRKVELTRTYPGESTAYAYSDDLSQGYS